MKHNNPIDHLVNQAEGNIVSDMGGEKVMLSIQNGKYYNLGEVGGAIWELMKEPITIQDLIIELKTHYDVEASECEKQVRSFLDQLLGEKLIDYKATSRKG